jgi:hypothetical protein
LERAVSPPASPSPVCCETTLKRVRINRQEQCWEISTLESLLARWREECSPGSLRDRDSRWLLVAVNKKVISQDFGSTPVSDGDEIVIAMGASAGG